MLSTFYKEVDGRREAELSEQDRQLPSRHRPGVRDAHADRNGVRIGDIRNPEKFATNLRALAADAAKRFEGFEYDGG